MLTSSSRSFSLLAKAGLAIGALSLGIPATWATDVRVYTDSTHPVSASSTVQVVRLDEPAHLQAELSKGLPNDRTLAVQTVRERLHSQGRQLNRRLATAYQGVVEAWSLGVLKVPAIVVDGRFVVYGDSDLAHALSLIQQYRGAKP
jgi:integrating conjugative element protein (TIGR03757 family)